MATLADAITNLNGIEAGFSNPHALDLSGFLSNGPSSGIGGGGGLGGGSGPVLNIPINGTTVTGTIPNHAGNTPTATSVGLPSVGQIVSFIGCVTSPTSCLLRLVILFIGLLCIAGAIYLYKPTKDIVAVPLRAARDSARDAAVAASAA